MNLRLFPSLLAAATIVFFAFTALGAAVSPPQLKVIATVVAHAKPQTHWVASQYAHGL